MEKSQNNDFGQVGDHPGTPIQNKAQILSQIDQTLQREKPPALEYILVRPYSQLTIPFTNYGLCWNTFGHAAVRYTLPDGQQYVMNIEGKRDKLNMVQFREPTEFFYGTDLKLTGDQRALYNRSMVTIRVEELPPENLIAMHNYFLQLKEEVDQGRTRFYIIPSPLRDLLSPIVPFSMIQYGNCAKWTSEGLKRAGVVTNSSYWPKSIWIHMFENYQQTAIGTLNNMSVVSYRRIQHAQRYYGKNSEPLTQVAPFQGPRTFCYFNLERFANCIVEVPKDQTLATTRIQENPKTPSPWRNLFNNKFVIGGSVIFSTLLIGRYSLFTRAQNLQRYRSLFSLRREQLRRRPKEGPR